MRTGITMGSILEFRQSPHRLVDIGPLSLVYVKRRDCELLP